ncbi:hypothetical protein YC2023_103467 [Brassica napus]
MEQPRRSPCYNPLWMVVGARPHGLKQKQLEAASMVFSVTSRGTVREGLHILRYGIGQLVSRPRPAVYRQKTNPQRVGTERDMKAQLPSLVLREPTFPGNRSPTRGRHTRRDPADKSAKSFLLKDLRLIKKRRFERKTLGTSSCMRSILPVTPKHDL